MRKGLAITGMAVFAAVALAAVLAGCGDKEPPPPPPQQAVKEEVVQEKPKEQPNYFYTPIGKRDPFRPFFLDLKANTSSKPSDQLTPLELFELEQLKLVAILTGMETPMAMVEDPEGKGYSVTIGTPIGKNGGRVARITKDDVVVEEEYYNSEGKRIINKVALRLPKEAAAK